MNKGETMITASEARAKMETVRRNDGVSHEIERVELEIDQAIRKGNDNIVLGGTIKKRNNRIFTEFRI